MKNTTEKLTASSTRLSPGSTLAAEQNRLERKWKLQSD
jgi:hypothetical protein